MADDTILTPLNFNATMASRSIMDKNAGIEIIFGYVSGLPEIHSNLLQYHNGFSIALMNKGMTQELLDAECRKLTETCRTRQLDLLITKSDLPFDARWYWIGDLRTLFEDGINDKIHLPVSAFLYDEILQKIGS